MQPQPGSHGRGQLHRFGTLVHEDGLGQEGVGPAGVDRDLEVRDGAHRRRVGRGDPLAQITVGAPRIDPVHVVGEGVEGVPPLGSFERRHVDHGAHHQRARQLGRIHLGQCNLTGQGSLGLIAVDCAIDPEARALPSAVDHDDGDLQRGPTTQGGDGNRTPG